MIALPHFDNPVFRVCLQLAIGPFDRVLVIVALAHIDGVNLSVEFGPHEKSVFAHRVATIAVIAIRLRPLTCRGRPC
jgi:hypothetical protein